MSVRAIARLCYAIGAQVRRPAEIRNSRQKQNGRQEGLIPLVNM